MAKSTISMAIFNSYVTLPEGKFSEYEYVKYVNGNSSDLSSGKHGWNMLHFTSIYQPALIHRGYPLVI